MANPKISSITLLDGSIYDLKDIDALTEITSSAIVSALGYTPSAKKQITYTVDGETLIETSEDELTYNVQNEVLSLPA